MNTIPFNKTNVNPKNRNTPDCSTRALVAVTGKSYSDCVHLQAEMVLKHCYSFASRQTVGKVLESLGFIKHPQPRKTDGTLYRIGEARAFLSWADRQDGVLISTRSHFTAIRDDEVVDTWDCRDYCVGVYWTRPRARY